MYTAQIALGSLTNQWRITALHHRHKVTAQGRLSNFVSERIGPSVPELIVNLSG